MHMTPSHKLGITLAAVLALVVIPARVHAAAIAYTVTDLGTLGGGNSYGIGINSYGQVAGSSDTPVAQHSVRWTGTPPTDLGSLGGSYSNGLGINDSGQVAGWSDITGDILGFRAASVPEPSSALLLVGSGMMLLLRRQRGSPVQPATPARLQAHPFAFPIRLGSQDRQP